MSRTHMLLCILLLTITAINGCASFKPVVTTPQQTSVESAPLTVVPIEGRPQSVLLKIQWLSPEPFTHLVLYRLIPDADPIALHTLQYTPQIVEQLQQGLVLLDPTIEPGPSHYTTVVMDGESILEVAHSQFEWSHAPSAPSVRHSIIDHKVVLNWDSPKTYGAVVFRRDLLTEEGLIRIADLQSSHHGFFVDSNVNPEGVYAYRVALMETPAIRGGSDVFPRFGSPSDEIYVTVQDVAVEVPQKPLSIPEETP